MSVIDKILKKIKNHSRFAIQSRIGVWVLAGLWAFLAVSCVDDQLIVEDPSSPDLAEMNEDVLQFTISVDKSMKTRAGLLNTRGVEDMDDWIDMQDKFRVFFFTEKGDFLFGANDRIVGSAANANNSSAQDYWYVRIPMTMIVDRNNQEYDMAKIKRYLKTHSFKIAVLANWPNAGDKVNPGDYDDSAENNFKDNPSSTLKGEPLWSWENSVLNEDATDIKNINDLHHIYNDLYINDDPGATGRPKRYDVFAPFMNNYLDNGGTTYKGFGQPTDWVKMRDIQEKGAWAPKGEDPKIGNKPAESFDSKVTANQWIRAYWNPNLDLNENKKIYRHYQHLWFLWNFNAIYNIGKIYDAGIKAGYQEELKNGEPVDFHDDTKTAAKQYYGGNFQWNDGRTIGNLINKWGEEWWRRNGWSLYTNWIKGHEDNLKDMELKKGSATNSAYLEFMAPASTSAPAQLATVRIDGTDRYGIKLPQLVKGNGTGDNMKVSVQSSGYFKFQARTSGTLRIRWGSADDKKASIVVQRNYDIRDRKYTIDPGNQNKWFDIKEESEGLTTDNFRDITIGNESENIYIFCQEGNAVIYGIEFIRGEYLYLTDREGVAPNENQGIPMYGVQSFPPQEDWVVGTTLNLTTNVSLIRALAKIELYIPASYGLPKHVYMRGMNRTAHCEPMDVETNTSELWNGESHNFENGVPTDGGVNCEWYNIQKYAPAYVYDGKDVGAYQNHLSWFYGSWQKATWFPEGYTPGVKNDQDSEDKKKEDNEETDIPTQGKTLQGRYYDPQHGHYKADRYKGWTFSGLNVPGKDNDGEISSEMKNVLISTKKNEEGKEEEILRHDHYPHLFNPHINRSEFCSFLYAGKVQDGSAQYYKYVLYMPDKFINDPIYPGYLGSTPKVPHIEFRFQPEEKPVASDDNEFGGEAVDANYNNSEFNLDDNDCYRIYFTNYGYSRGGQNDFFQTEYNSNIRKVGKESYDTYEASADNLKYHWPVMRNHVYQFFVNSSGPATPVISVKVTDWSHEKVIVDW